MPRDSQGNEIFVGDTILVRAKVTDVTPDHVLTRTVEAPNRELWFQSEITELADQGPLSKSKSSDEVAQIMAADEEDLKARAIAHVKSRGYSQEAAEAVVAKFGAAHILANPGDEADGAPGKRPESNEPKPSVDPNAAAAQKQVEAAQENQAATEGVDPQKDAPAEVIEEAPATS